MRIQSIIAGIRAQWAANLAEIPLYLQLAPENAQVPYCVMNFGSIQSDESTIPDFDYSATITFICYSGNDADCLARMDRIRAAFDWARYAGPYYSAMNSATFDVQYTDPGALWSSEMQFSIRWNLV